MSAVAVPDLRHSATNAAASGLLRTTASASGWSIAMAQKLAPNRVSGRVVNTSTLGCGAGWASWKRNFMPVDLPIQFSCIRRTFSGQWSSVFSPSSRSSEKSVILKNHWLSLRRSTSAPERQPRPSITCSLARTVWSTGSQFTQLSFRYTSPALYRSRNSACSCP